MDRIRFLDLSIEKDEKKKLLKNIDKVFSHGIFVNGPEIQEFESLIANFCNRKYAVGVASGSDALYLALRALDIGEGDEVITTSLSWIATANAIKLTGATPVFADIKNDLNIDPKSIKKLITDKTKAILPVHYCGKIADMEAIENIAQNNNLYIIEDASQSFGSEKYGKVAGSFGDIACFSLNPMKIFAALGEAGVVVTDSLKIKKRLESLRYNGTINKEICMEPGLNSRLDTLQAAILIERFKNLNNIINKRRKNAELYKNLLKDVKEIKIPYENEYERDVYYSYTIQAEKRDDLIKYLIKKNIEVKIYHPILMPFQPAYKKYCKYETNRAEKIVKKILCLPIHEKLNESSIKKVVKEIKSFYKLRSKY